MYELRCEHFITVSMCSLSHICESHRPQGKYVDNEHMETVLKCSHRNSYMAYSEAVLLAMLGDDDPAVRAEPRLWC